MFKCKLIKKESDRKRVNVWNVKRVTQGFH